MVEKLEFDGIYLEFGLRKILSDIHLVCEVGKIVGLLGRNGEGKSSLMNIVYGRLESQSESIRFNGVTVHDLYKTPYILTLSPQFNYIPKEICLNRIFSDFDLIFSNFLNYFPEFDGSESMTLEELSGGQRRLIEVYVIIYTLLW